ncbi:histone deacetylase 4-like isoform X2 [Carcharodon carcharias]|uniref:histone deacetylase 4-like isoform X2 n=1 Tax=Carcharodon carcharias TaxID=13397 RepID=UPI001B7EB73C|nr:histone deacetylase 4-like isoform X2 [Carcharodon carcharias]
MSRQKALGEGSCAALPSAVAVSRRDPVLQPRECAGMDLRTGQRYAKPTAQRLSQGDNHQQQLLITQLQRCHQLYSTAHLQPDIKYRLQQSCESAGNVEHTEKRPILWHKDKGEQSAVASLEVKQRLQEFVLKKQQAALKQCDSGGPVQTSVNYMPRNQLLTPAPRSSQPRAAPAIDPLLTAGTESLSAFPLRKTASEPNLKLRVKLKQKTSERRRSPLLRRKDSAPASLRKRAPDSRDPSPVRSRNTSRASLQNQAAPSENGHNKPNIDPENSFAQHLLVHEGSLVQLTIPSRPALPNITQGLPTSIPAKGLIEEMGGHSLANLPSRLHTHDTTLLTGHSPVTYIHTSALEREAGAARLQPVLILEPSMGRGPLLAVSGMGTMPLFYAHPLVASDCYAPRISKIPHHRPLGRTQSAPLPQSPKSVQQQLQTQLQHQMFLERLKQQTHLGKLMSKRKASHGEEGEAERVGQGAGGVLHRPQPRVSEDGQQLNEGKIEEGSARLGKREHTEGDLQQQALLWDQHWIHQLQHLPPMETLGAQYPAVCHRPLSRARSSPASASVPAPAPEIPSKPSFTTGIAYDSMMLKHQCTCGNSNHAEHAGRIQSIWSRLQETGLRSQCECIRGRKATLEELQSVHTEQHVLLYGTNPLHRLKLDSRKLLGILSQRMFVVLPCGGLGVDSDTVWNELHSSSAARVAVGCVLELAFKVASGKLKNGFAIVRPPGHHAEPSTAMGFCFFNSVAIAAKQLLQKSNAKKILIVDWDVHHGNGTQQVFYSDPSVLYISLHRHDNGNFFPGSGAADEVGSGPGEGFNVNIAWSGGLDPPMGDAEYLAAFRTVVMPIAQEFGPDVVLVSSGFDSVEGHSPQLGGYKVSAKCFGHLTRQLMTLAEGRVAMVLEGGHELTAICDASEACVTALLGKELESLPEQVLQQQPNTNSVQSLEKVIRVQSKYWTSVQQVSQTVGQSLSESQTHDKDESETVNALASLSVGVSGGGVTDKGPIEEPMEDDASA